MRVPNHILRIAVFLGVDGPTGIEYRGTGYIVSGDYGAGYEVTVSTEAGRTIRCRYPFMFLVTAAYVAEELEEADFYIRANKKDGSLAEMKQEGPTQWWYHPTERDAVDAAAMLLPVNEVLKLDFEMIHVSEFVDEEKITSRNLGIGDEVFIAGLFNNAKGVSKNIPIIRIGNVAMMPKEKILFRTKNRPEQWLHADLLEARSIGGLSGSPVFIRETVNIEAGSRIIPGFAGLIEPGLEKLQLAGVGRFHFFGSLIGHWQIPVSLSDTHTQAEAVNMGIAPMVPAQKVLEVLGQPKLVIEMNKISAQIGKEHKQKNGSATLDHSPTIPYKKTFTEKDFEVALKKASRKIEPKSKT